MAKQKKQSVETSSTTLDSGTVVHGSKELIDRLSGGGSSGSTSTSSTSTRKATTSDSTEK